MSGLDPIASQSSPGPACAKAPRDHGHALSILHQIRHALGILIETGEETRIDLNAMPFGPGDLERLTDVLGRGEVQASVEALGPTLIQETAIPGVWLVDYRGTEDQRLTLHIEIALTPEILRPRPEDLAESIATLDSRMPRRDLEPGDSPPTS
ncbi:hydrogenase expression/formation protein [Thiocystis violacea]|uniref:hydrogenase expression/formation protein n=1 Tax=Thiocystis violacea TaxID=13725 RepID=UPI0019045E88|nr:hydrogenase expression/formation protein [Thiocystis violacea]MBK1719517.1 hydrogenase expression protein HupH [Thiocystis violacea]